MDAERLHSLLSAARGLGTDINEHLSTLMAMASSCDQIVEFGVNAGSSTLAFLAGGCGKLDSWDITRTPQVADIEAVAGEKFTFHLEDSLKANIPTCDLLFIDSLHTASHLAGELAIHNTRVRTHIVLHDTESYGHIGEDKAPGLRTALMGFLLTHTDWRIENHYAECNGLTVLRRVNA